MLRNVLDKLGGIMWFFDWGVFWAILAVLLLRELWHIVIWLPFVNRVKDPEFEANPDRFVVPTATISRRTAHTHLWLELRRIRAVLEEK